MQFKLLAVSFFASMVAAQCFDAGDCILAGGGDCTKSSGALLGSCVKSGAVASPTATGPGTGTCFDSGDCILAGGGNCVVPKGKLTGTCVK